MNEHYEKQQIMESTMKKKMQSAMKFPKKIYNLKMYNFSSTGEWNYSRAIAN